jgi:steroid delta-isomerase-like uncharacterized protein
MRFSEVACSAGIEVHVEVAAAVGGARLASPPKRRDFYGVRHMADRAARERIVQEHVKCELAHDLDALVQTFTGASSWEDLAASETHDGHNGIRDHYRDLFTGFPDFAFETVRKHATDEAVVLEVVVTGTHAATWKGIPATGKAVRFPLCAVFTFASDDKINAEIVYYDRLTVLSQLGVA